MGQLYWEDDATELIIAESKFVLVLYDYVKLIWFILVFGVVSFIK